MGISIVMKRLDSAVTFQRFRQVLLRSLIGHCWRASRATREVIPPSSAGYISQAQRPTTNRFVISAIDRHDAVSNT